MKYPQFQLAIACVLLGIGFQQYAVATRLPVVDLGYERHRAIDFNETGNYYNFSNIRYAAPPLGDRRWRVPVAPKRNRRRVQTGEKAVTCPTGPVPWSETANEFVPAYLEGRPFNPTPKPPPTDEELTRQLPSSTEDCLFLDVFSPRDIFHRAGRRRGAPVIVWLHGGGFALSSKIEGVSPAGLLQRAKDNSKDGVVFVAINYRIGVFGWLGGSTLQKDGVANAGLYDQRFALEWVQKNIHLFGGDPRRVTVMGNSAGGSSIIHHITAYGGRFRHRTPFQQAIIQSPGFLPQASPKSLNEVFDQFLSVAKVKSLKEARALDTKDLIDANALHIGRHALYGLFIYGPTVDGSYTPALPGQLLESGRFDKSVKIMTGHTSREGLLFVDPYIQSESDFEAYLRRTFPTISPDSLEHIATVLYPPVFDGTYDYKDQTGRVSLLIAEMTFICNTFYTHAAFRNNTYGYRFNLFPGLHAADVPYTFYQDSGPTEVVSNSTVALALQQYETTFAQTRRPKGRRGIPRFPKYTDDADIIDFTDSNIFPTRDDAANERCRWWQKGLFV